MTKNVLRFSIVSLLFSAGFVFAQNSAPPSARPRQEPCWKQAGISPSVMEQHHAIELDRRSQVETVCQNSSLTPQQKQQQVREIRQQAQQKMDALITPEQQSTLHACQQQRGMNGSSNGGQHPGGAMPCGNFGSSQGRQGPSNGRAPGSNPQPATDVPQN